MRKLVFLSILFLPLFFLTAEEPEIRLFVNKERVSLNERFQVNLQIMGSAKQIGLEEVPSIEGISLSLSGQSSSMQMVNTRVTQSMTYIFLGRSERAGSYEIGPFKINIKGKIYLSDKVKIEVVDGGEADENGSSTLSSAGDDNYLLRMTISKDDVYVNEYVDVIVRLYMAARLEPINYRPVSFPTSTWVEDSRGNSEYLGQVRINGTVYREYELERKRIYIPNAGEYRIKPAVYEFYGFRTNDIFAEPERLSIKSEELALNVKPLPELEAIAQKLSYKGAVGSFKLTSRISRTSLKVKDSVTLSLALEGQGNFYAIDEIGVSHNSLVEEYSSKSELTAISSNESSKSWEVLLVPNEEGRFEVKVEDFTYFDIEQEKYITLKGELYNIDVTKADGTIDKNVIIKPETKKQDEIEVNSLFEDISYIKTRSGGGAGFFNFRVAQKIFFYSYILLLLVLAIFLLTRLLRGYLQSSGADLKPALKLFNSELNGLMKERARLDHEMFTDEISRLIERYISRRFEIDLIKFTSSGIKSQLAGLVSEEALAGLKEIIVQLDMVRFGGMDIDRERIDSLVAEIKRIIKTIDEQRVKA